MDKNISKETEAPSKDFERKIVQLQSIVDKLENDPSVTLEESMTMFEKGLKLTKECVDDLNAVQSRITDLNKQLDDILSRSVFGDNDEC